MAKNNKRDDYAGLIFVGCMFIGAGLGFILNNVVAFGALGMGVGFLGMALYSTRRKK